MTQLEGGEKLKQSQDKERGRKTAGRVMEEKTKIYEGGGRRERERQPNTD